MRIYGLYAEQLEQEIVEYALVKMEISNGEDKSARKALKIIENYHKLLRDADKVKEKHGRVRW